MRWVGGGTSSIDNIYASRIGSVRSDQTQDKVMTILEGRGLVTNGNSNRSYDFSPHYAVAFEMSGHDEASPGPDDNTDNAVFPTETEEKTTSTPEKDQFVYPDTNLVQHTVSGLETSRKHGPPHSVLSTEIASNGNAQQFYSNVDSKLHSKSLVNLRSPPDALQETGEGGRKRSMNLPLRKVVSLGSGEPRRDRRTRSEGTTPPKDKIAVLLLETQELLVKNQALEKSLEKEQSANKLLEDNLEKERSVKLQASNDESISPLMVQQLKDRIFTLEKELKVLSDKYQKQKSLIQSLQQKKRDESEEKTKFEALYADEKRKGEDIEKQAEHFKTS